MGPMGRYGGHGLLVVPRAHIVAHGNPAGSQQKQAAPGPGSGPTSLTEFLYNKKILAGGLRSPDPLLQVLSLPPHGHGSYIYGDVYFVSVVSKTDRRGT